MNAKIRLATESDASNLLEIYAPVVRETAISFEVEPPPLEEFRNRIRSTLHRMPWLVCAAGDDILGYAYATGFRAREAYQWAVEVTVYVHPNHHRKGVGRALYTSLFRCLQIQGYCRAIAAITLPNTASVALHEAFGFEHIGVFESVGYKRAKWHDTGWWQLEIRPAPSSPAAPTPLNELSQTPEWKDALEAGAALLNNKMSLD